MIYRHKRELQIPDVDLLTLLYDSDFCRANEDTPIYAEANEPTTSIITKARARSLAKNFAYFFRKHYGIGEHGENKDVVIGISTGQSVLPCLFHGVLAAGGVYSGASSASTPADLARQIKDGPAKVVVCSKDLLSVVKKAASLAGLPERNVVTLTSRPEVELASSDGAHRCDFKDSLDWRRITDREELENSKIGILYSSGTTGLPKGVLVSHRMMVAEVVLPQTLHREIYDEWEKQGRGFPRTTLAHLPTAHVAGLQIYFVNIFYEAGIVYWMPSFNFDDFLRYCDELEITNFFTVPPIYIAIAKHPAVKDQFRNVKIASTGAAPLTGELQAAASKKVNGVTIKQVWGLSETTGTVTQSFLGEEPPMGSLSPLLPNILLRLVDENDKDVEPGQPGEALLKGPVVTKGYHNNPEANKTAFTSDGWFRTGDILRMEGDHPFIVDRKKELIKYKGMQVAPAELEGLLASHDAILDAAVIGIDQDDTEVPRAYVVLAPTAKGKVSADDLVAFVKGKVAHYKQLRGGVVFVDVVPRSPSGKILRKDLRELAKREKRQAGSKI